jgi:heme exporter protein A
MLDSVLSQVGARGRTVVMTSHNLSRAAGLASRFDVISHGLIAASTSRDDLVPEELLSFYNQAINIG